MVLVMGTRSGLRSLGLAGEEAASLLTGAMTLGGFVVKPSSVSSLSYKTFMSIPNPVTIAVQSHPKQWKQKQFCKCDLTCPQFGHSMCVSKLYTSLWSAVLSWS